MKFYLMLLAALLAMAPATYLWASGDHGEEGHAEEGEEHGEGTTAITDKAAQASGVGTATAGPGSIHEMVSLNGTIGFHPTSTAKISARYAGVVKRLHVGLGDKVKAGQTLATVESNISLSGYAVTAPIGGVIVEQGARVGEATSEAPLMTIANPSKLRATLQSFPSDGKRIKPGQPVTLNGLGDNHTFDYKVTSVVPDPDSSTPLILVVVDVENPKGEWTAGSAIIGKVEVDEHPVELMVNSAALQPFENGQAVFVKEGEKYQAHPVKTGLADATHTQITEGLKAGDVYVTSNSYIIKADIEKSGASHDH
ncbi:MAG TPA: HlyD family efflux transporter periplasmic adaptor subunit [Alphaproteobacteria bacterium]|nr:HlyD family efflux transporter periplasmic adaptor subunit [Alphaproteobacteria bacterium]